MASGIRSKLYVVMLVDDDEIIRDLYGLALREAGFIVDEAASLGEALDLGARTRPDLVILDRHLPDGDGWDVARAMKADDATKDAPIVGFTSHKGRSDVEGALVAGCDSFLEKGTTPLALVRHVRGLLGLALDDVGVARA